MFGGPSAVVATDSFAGPAVFFQRTMARYGQAEGEGDERTTDTQISPLETLDDDSLFRIVSFADVQVSYVNLPKYVR